MPVLSSTRDPVVNAALLAALLGTGPLLAQEPVTGVPSVPDSATAASWDVTLARGATRTIDFTTSEGTWMAVSPSPDGGWVVFDLTGHIYRVAAEGGTAQPLTQESGVAVSFQPVVAPDGRHIAFVSDRKGQNNLWIMNADGSEPRAVFTDLNVRVAEPAWTPDGRYLVVSRQKISQPGQPGTSGIWMYHRDGGTGVELVGDDVQGAAWPSVSADGEYVYFQASANAENPVSGDVQIRRFEFATGDIIDITAGESRGAAAGRISSGGAAAPEVSPDGRWLAFARSIPDGTISYRGHEYGPRTALWLRDLATGEERVLMDPITTMISSGSKALGILPRYRWAADGSSLVLSQGGKLRRVEVASGSVTTISFSARVQRTISEMAYSPFRIRDDSVHARFLRWHTASPDGKRIAVQAVGRVWVSDADGRAPRRLTPASFSPLEYAPSWSPDGRWLAFTGWDDVGRGHLYKVRATGGQPEKLTREPGDYAHTVWSPDGDFIVAARGAGATAQGRGIGQNAYFDMVRVPAGGGAATVIASAYNPSGASLGSVARRQIVRPSFGPGGRLFFPRQRQEREGGENVTLTDLVSVEIDGGDELTHLTLPEADEIVPSPDGDWVAFQEGDNVYLTPFFWPGVGGEPLRVNKRTPKLPVRQVSTGGGLFPRWRSADVLEFGSGTTYYAHHVQDERTDSASVAITVPRDLPDGRLALTNARVITLDDRGVVENATVVVQGSRIACIGQCDAAGADRVIDAAGKTIIPGLIDMHSHHYREHRGMRPRRDYETAIYLAYGVTTNLDNSVWSQNIFPTAELIEAGEIIGPRTFSTGDPLYRGDSGRQNEITSYEVAEQNVNRLADWGAVSIKQYQQPRRDQRQWISDAARKRGLMVTAEGGDLNYNLGMIMDGQTGWEHPLSIVPIYGDVAKFVGQANAVYSPTLVVAGPGPWNIEYFYGASDVWKDPKQRRWMPWRMLIPHTRTRTLRPETDYSYPMLAEGMKQVIAEGGWGALGSHGEHHGLAAHWELWMAASALGPQGALEVASKHGAHFLGAEQDLGTLTEGKLADLLVLNSNPLDDIRNSADLLYVVKAGRVYAAETLDEVWPRQRPFGEYYWVDEDALRADSRPVDIWDRPAPGSTPAAGNPAAGRGTPPPLP